MGRFLGEVAAFGFVMMVLYMVFQLFELWFQKLQKGKGKDI